MSLVRAMAICASDQSELGKHVSGVACNHPGGADVGHLHAGTIVRQMKSELDGLALRRVSRWVQLAVNYVTTGAFRSAVPVT